jgi:hypothetical protein
MPRPQVEQRFYRVDLPTGTVILNCKVTHDPAAEAAKGGEVLAVTPLTAKEAAALRAARPKS